MPAEEKDGPIDITCDKLDYPKVAGSIDLVSYNRGELQEALLNPEIIVNDSPADGETPHGYQPRPPAEWLKYLGRVSWAGGLFVFGREELPHTELGEPLSAGFFAVPKPNGNFDSLSLPDSYLYLSYFNGDTLFKYYFI